jgi:hypothetical protein
MFNSMPSANSRSGIDDPIDQYPLFLRGRSLLQFVAMFVLVRISREVVLLVFAVAMLPRRPPGNK